MNRRAILAACLVPAAATPPAGAVTTTLRILDFNAFNQYSWSDPSIWDTGVPGASSDVAMPNQFNGPAGPVAVRVVLQNAASVLSLTQQPLVTLDVFGGSLAVAGVTQANGFLSVTAGVLSLGTFSSYDAAARTMRDGPTGILVSDGSANQPARLEFRGADIEINEAGFNLFGAGAAVTDQLTGADAFRNLRLNRGLFTLDDGFVLSAQGGFTNAAGAGITLGLNPSERIPELRVAGDFSHAGDLFLRGNSLVSIAGAVAASGFTRSDGTGNRMVAGGTFSQTGGAIDLGPDGPVDFQLAAPAIVFAGNAVVTGSGTLAGNVTVAAGTLSPGRSAGEIAVHGDLSFQNGALLNLELGGLAASASDRVTQSAGTVTLGGTLRLSILPAFADSVMSGSRFTLLTGTAPLAGAFLNVPNGGRLVTAEGTASFRVEYGPAAAAPASLVVTDYQVSPQTFAQWAARHDLGPGQNQPGDDPNGDGISNLEAYFRGIPPFGTAPAGSYRVIYGTGMFFGLISGSRATSGVSLATEISTNLTDWAPGPTPVVYQTTAARQFYSAAVPAGSAGRRFMRFKIVKSP